MKWDFLSSVFRCVFVVVLWSLTACTNNTLLHHYQSIGHEGWSRGDTLLFSLPSDSVNEVPCLLFVELRLTPLYPYSTLCLVAEEEWDGTVSQRDTLLFTLSDSTGNLCGRGLNLLQYEQSLRPLTLRPASHGQLRLRHIMSREVMPGVNDVGIKLKRQTPVSFAPLHVFHGESLSYRGE